MRRFAWLGVAFVAGALCAGIGLTLVGNPLTWIQARWWPTSIPVLSTESPGDRLRRECGSIVDAAGVKIAKISVFMVLEEDTELMKLARAKEKWMPDQAAYLEREHPDRWAAAIVEATRRAREDMIRSCILSRGGAAR